MQMSRKRASLFTAFAVIVALAGGVYLVGCQPKKPVTLRMTGPEWGPTQLMAQISKDFSVVAKQKLGYPVELQFDFVPWGSYYERLAAALAAGSPTYDLFVSDSQWIGQFAEAGHIIKLNEPMEKDAQLKAILDKMLPSLKDAYSAYPEGSADYWGFPQEADVKGWMIRIDLFTHPDERAAFKKKYGYDLPQTYEEFDKADWVHVRDFAEFFTRKAGQTLAGQKLATDFYGLATPYSKSYDFLTMGWLMTFYNWGGQIWDPATHKVDGFLNSKAGVDSLTFYMDLLKFQPPGAKDYDFDGVNQAMSQGITAMAMNWIAVSPGIFDPASSKVADKVLMCVPPGHTGEDGQTRRMFNLGGQPFVVGSKTKHLKEVFEFIKWWFDDAQQARFADGGGLSVVQSIVESDSFKNSQPYARAFAEALPYQQDVWKNAAFFELLNTQQEELHAAVSGAQSPKDALDKTARKQEEILRKAGLLK